MSIKTDTLLSILHVLAWIACIGFCVEAGAILISYIVSIGNAGGAKNLYDGLNLHPVREHSFWHYTGSVSLLLAIPLLEAYTAFLVARVLSRINVANPFTVDVSKALEKASYIILLTWCAVMLYNAHMKWLSKKIATLSMDRMSGEFLFIAAIVFVIAQIFKKGVELQEEKELTI